MNRRLPIEILLLSFMAILIASANVEAAFISSGIAPHGVILAGSGTSIVSLSDGERHAQSGGTSIDTASDKMGLVELCSNPSMILEINAFNVPVFDTASSVTNRQANFSPVGIMIAQAATGLVPEPGSIVLAAFGLFGFVAWCWRRPLGR